MAMVRGIASDIVKVKDFEFDVRLSVVTNRDYRRTSFPPRSSPSGYQHYGLVRLTRLGRGVPWVQACDLVREPDAGDLHFRFDERCVERESRSSH